MQCNVYEPIYKNILKFIVKNIFCFLINEHIYYAFMNIFIVYQN